MRSKANPLRRGVTASLLIHGEAWKESATLAWRTKRWLGAPCGWGWNVGKVRCRKWGDPLAEVNGGGSQSLHGTEALHGERHG